MALSRKSMISENFTQIQDLISTCKIYKGNPRCPKNSTEDQIKAMSHLFHILGGPDICFICIPYEFQNFGKVPILVLSIPARFYNNSPSVP